MKIYQHTSIVTTAKLPAVCNILLQSKHNPVFQCYFFELELPVKKLLIVSALALVSVFTAPVVQAANDSSTLTVTINLTSKCVFGAIAPVVFTYTSFQATAATATGGTFNMKCTNTMPYKIGFTNATTPASSDAVTDDAVNLAYTLGVSAATGTGSGVDQAYTVTGSMALGQPGTCLTATCTNTAATNKTRTVYVVY